MKRKIRIIIAGIVVASGIVALLAPAKNASAATWCTLENGEYQEHYAKFCARAIVGDHKDTKLKETYQTGYNSNSTATYTVSQWCSGYQTVCKKIIKDHLAYNNNGSTAPTKDYFVNMIYQVFNGSVSKADPCANQSGPDSVKESCKKSNWEYYYKTQQDIGGNNNSGSGGSGGGGSGGSGGEEDPAKTGNCTSILPASWCNKENPESLQDSGIVKMVQFVISVMTGAVVVAGTIGIIICGVLWMTARDNPTQIATAKRRLLEIVIGMVAWGLIAVLINFFIPQTEAKTEEVLGVEIVKNEETKA